MIYEMAVFLLSPGVLGQFLTQKEQSANSVFVERMNQRMNEQMNEWLAGWLAGNFRHPHTNEPPPLPDRN